MKISKFLLVCIGTMVLALSFSTCIDITGCDDDNSLVFDESVGAKNIGRRGPGGGIIFDYFPYGFTVEGYGNLGDEEYFETYTAYYLEAAPEDSPEPLAWAWPYNAAGWYNTISISQEETLGRGRRNTALILAIEGDNAPAASYCNTLTEGGQTDWFLPSMDELIVLYLNKALDDSIGTFSEEDSNLNYWSSTEGGTNSAQSLRFAYGGGNNTYKNTLYRVRAIRVF